MTRLDHVVATPRLRLELITPDEAAGMLAGRRRSTWHPDYPRQDDLAAVSMIRPESAETGWGPRHVVRAFDGLVVGSIGFFGPPHPAADGVPETEIGYGLVADARGHGAATEAVRGLLAQTDRLGVRVLATCGFTELRGSDEEGNLVMARPLPVRDASEGRGR